MKARALLKHLAPRLVGAGAVTLATSLGGQGLVLISGIIAARALGPEGRGTLALLWLAPMILVLIGGLGIPQAATYFVAREGKRARLVVVRAVEMTALLAVILSCVQVGVLFLIAGLDHDVTLAAALASLALVPAFLAQNLGVAVLLGQERYMAFNLARGLPALGYACGTVALLALGNSQVSAFLTVALTAWCFGAALGWTMVRGSLSRAEPHSTVSRSEIARFGLRGVVGSVSPIDDVRLDQLVVGMALDARALGLYVAAIAFCNLPRFFAQSVGAVALPRIAGAKGAERAWAMVVYYVKIGLVLVGVAVVALEVCVPFLLPLLFGAEFESAIEVARILLVAAFFLAVHRLLIELARGLGHPGYGSISELANTAVFLLALFLVTSAGAATDVAWSVLAGAVVGAGLLTVMLLRIRPGRGR